MAPLSASVVVSEPVSVGKTYIPTASDGDVARRLRVPLHRSAEPKRNVLPTASGRGDRTASLAFPSLGVQLSGRLSV